MQILARCLPAVALGAAYTALAESTPLVVDLWPGTAPDQINTNREERVRMSPKLDLKQVEVTEQTRLITGVTKPSITLYQPATNLHNQTAVLICPGGGYWDLYWQLEGEEVAAWLNSLGITGVILKYRVPRQPDEPEREPARRPLQDAQRAMRIVRSHAAEWNLDPERIGIIGFSAGGHLALSTATSFDVQSYAPLDAIDQLSSRPNFAIAAYSGYLKAKDKDELAPGLRVPTNTPPVFLVHGGEDLISGPDRSVLMYLALKRAGVSAELHIYAGTAHDFAVRPSQRPYGSWTQACANWLRDQGFLAKDAK
jgi:acetyl esterase/lipase